MRNGKAGLVLVPVALVALIVVGLMGDESPDVSRDPGRLARAGAAANGAAETSGQLHDRKPLSPASREILLVKVLDRDTGDVVPGATVTLRPWIGSDAEPSTASTSSMGECRFAITPPKLVKIGVNLAGYRHRLDRIVSIRSSQSVTLELTPVAAHDAGKAYLRVMVAGKPVPTDVDFTVLAASAVTGGYSHADDWQPADKDSVRTYPNCLEIVLPGTYYILATTGDSVSSHMAVRVIEGESSARTMKLEPPVRLVNSSDVALSYSYSILLDGAFLRAPVVTVEPRAAELVPAGMMVAVSRPHVLVRGSSRESQQAESKFALLSPGEDVVAVVPKESTMPCDEFRIVASEPGHSYVVGIEGEIGRGRPRGEPSPYPVLGTRFFAAPGLVRSRADDEVTLRWPRVEHNHCGLYLSMHGEYVRLATLASPSSEENALRGGALGALQLTGGIVGQRYVIQRRLADGESIGTLLADAMLDVGYVDLDARGEALIPLVAGPFYRAYLVHRNLHRGRGTALDFRVAPAAATLLDVSRLQDVPEKRVLRWQGAAVSSASQSAVPGSALVSANRIQLVQPVTRAHNNLRVVLADGTEFVYSVWRLWEDGTEALPSGQFEQRAIQPSAEQAPHGCAAAIPIRYMPTPTAGTPKRVTVAVCVNANGWVEMSGASEHELRHFLDCDVHLFGGGEEAVLKFVRDDAGGLRYRLLGHWTTCTLFIDADGRDVDARGPIVAIDDPRGDDARLEVLGGRVSARLSKPQANLSIDAYHADGSSVVLSGSVVREKEGWSCRLRR